MSTEEIENLREIAFVLTYYYQATLQLSGSKYATISLVHPIFYGLLDNMQPNNEDKDMTILLKQCLIYYTEYYMKKYILSNETWYCAASFLDLRYKMFSQLKSQARAATKLRAIQKLTEIVEAGPTHIRDFLKDNSTGISQAQRPQTKIMHTLMPKFNTTDLDVSVLEKKSINKNSKSKFQMEIDKYSAEPSKIIEPCEFWKQNSKDYPCLFYCAKMIFSIPASSVPVESVFSDTAGQVNPHRNRLSPEKVNKMMVIHEFYN